MGRVRQKGTAAELAVRKIVDSCGYQFDENVTGLAGSPDLVVEDIKAAIFVHGCFWHAHKGCDRFKLPKENRRFWKLKFEENRRRDRRNIAALRKTGYRVFVVWECELADKNHAARAIATKLEAIRNDHWRRVPGKTRVRSGYTASYALSKDGLSAVRVIELAQRRVGVSSVHLPMSSRAYSDPQTAFDHAQLRGAALLSLTQRRRQVRVADLFSGCGGLSLGARDASNALGLQFASRLAVDMNAAALDIYRENFSPDSVRQSDIRELLDGGLGTSPSTREKKLIADLGKVDIVLAGPPCQGHSNLNNHTRRSDERNALYERVARFAELIKPRFLLIENVPAVAKAMELTLYATIGALQAAGYRVSSGVVDLASLGVPQRRKRHVVVASRVRYIDIPAVLERHRVQRPRSLRWAIADLQNAQGEDAFSSSSQLSSDNQRRIRYLFGRNLRDLPNKLRPICHQNSEHTYHSMYGRLSFSKPSQTITSGFGSPGQGRFIHPTRRRTLTPHEAARLQYFPDSFSFEGCDSRGALAEAIGNAVPPKLSYVFVLDFLLREWGLR